MCPRSGAVRTLAQIDDNGGGDGLMADSGSSGLRLWLIAMRIIMAARGKKQHGLGGGQARYGRTGQGREEHRARWEGVDARGDAEEDTGGD